MAIGSPSFPDYLSRANVVGVAYGWEKSDHLGSTVPAISLVARDEKARLQAFVEFNAWADATDGDALELTFVFKKDGTYLLAVSPELSRLTRRCLGYERTSRIIAMMPCWVKPIDSTHPMLRELREYVAGFPCPFLLSGVLLPPLLLLSRAAAPPVRQIPGLKPLLKFEATFVEEDGVKVDSTAWVALQTASRKPEIRSGREPPMLQPAGIGDTRAKMLRTHFPVTLERLRRTEWFQTICGELGKGEVRPWQVEQAVCNLLLSLALLGIPHFNGLGRQKLHRKAIDGLRARFECADGSQLPELPVDLVETQIVADVSALMRDQRKPSQIQDLQAAQAALAAAGLLDAPSATELAVANRLRG